MADARFARIRAALLGVLLAGPSWAETCDPEVADLRLGESRYRFTVEVRDTARGRARGLMNRESLPRFSGMLFVYESPEPVAFWMRNTLIPLDMLFFDEAGRLVNVHENAVPLDETTIPGGEAIQYVLEINGGLSGTLGLAEGAELRHPAVDQENAAWACPVSQPEEAPAE